MAIMKLIFEKKNSVIWQENGDLIDMQLIDLHCMYFE